MFIFAQSELLTRIVAHQNKAAESSDSDLLQLVTRLVQCLWADSVRILDDLHQRRSESKAAASSSSGSSSSAIGSLLYGDAEQHVVGDPSGPSATQDARHPLNRLVALWNCLVKLANCQVLPNDINLKGKWQRARRVSSSLADCETLETHLSLNLRTHGKKKLHLYIVRGPQRHAKYP
ncbi:MAG: hypothetical protein MHMPM18_001200 [Marteilia pararefringens]